MHTTSSNSTSSSNSTALADPQHAAPPLISVIIPTYNRPGLLVARGLASVLAQRYPNLEVLVVMDGPDPATAAALAEIDDPRLRPLTLPENRGPSDARNYGVQHARGEWVAFLDDDDIWRPDKLARQLELAQHSAYPLPVVLCGYIGRLPHGDRLFPPRPKAADERLGDYMMVRHSASRPECPVFGILVFVSRELALRVPWPEGLRNNEDWEWMLRLEEVEGVGFEQVPPEESSTLALYYSGEERPTASNTSRWRPALAWAQRNREAGRLSERAFVGYLLLQVVPLAAQDNDLGGTVALGRALHSAGATSHEWVRFSRLWLMPAWLRVRLRRWMNTRRPPVRLPDTVPHPFAEPEMLTSRSARPDPLKPTAQATVQPAAQRGPAATIRVTFLIDSMTARAGMERATATVAGGLAALGLDVQILTLRGQTSAFELPGAVKLTSLNLPPGTLRMRTQTGPLVRELRRELLRQRPDVLITVDTFLAGFAFPAVLDLPMLRVAWELFNFKSSFNMRSRRLARVVAAHLGHQVVTLTEQDRSWWHQALPHARARITVIPIPLTVPRPVVNPYSPHNRVVLALGRLSGEKGFDLLLRAWAEIEREEPAADGSEWQLELYGEGGEELALRALAATLGLRRWKLSPRVPDVTAAYRAAGLYVLSSRHEGLPLVLMESQAYGVPAVAFDCPTGPAELLSAGGGVLVAPGDVSALAAALRSLMSHPERRQELSGRAYAGAERYNVPDILAQWIQMLAAGRSREAPQPPSAPRD
ncbi:glycosyltransferase [Deinococcus arenicola]|uniref:Glycosyltransferase n=1 Tax=Deinococcus arenicola TaxID=2994950 RepID=A0ABU4DMN3_9DEIO|nr:glycosyltransferase [Deinococcus sp. ZS9-10]MDV6373618.1 glycosyltransferase [Deinococcus sp. ZS9-10]